MTLLIHDIWAICIEANFQQIGGYFKPKQLTSAGIVSGVLYKIFMWFLIHENQSK